MPRQHQPGPGLEAGLAPAPRHEAARSQPARKLQGQVALITGGDSAIGRAVAPTHAREAADVAINDLPQAPTDADATRDAEERSGHRYLLPGDLTDPDVCTGPVERTVKVFERLDIMVSNAAHQNRKPIGTLHDDELETTFESTIVALIRLTRAALKHTPPGARIIATSSETGLLGSAVLPDDSATEGAINPFAKTVAQQRIEKGIRINAVAPGPV